MSATQTNPLRVVIIGYGLGGAVFHAPLVASTPGMVVAGIVTANDARQQQAQHDFPEARIHRTAEEIWQSPKDYDLVVITTSNRWHAPFGLAAMQAGLPVVIDKPFASSVAEVQALLACSASTGVPLTCFQSRRLDGDFLTVQQILAKDLLGPVFAFESRFERFRPQIKQDAWRELTAPEDAGGLLFDLGSHLIDQAIQLFGIPERVVAQMAQRRPGAQVDDDTFVALEFANGTTARLWMSAITRIAGPRFVLHGLHGSYVKYGLDPQEDALQIGDRPGDTGWGVEARAAWGNMVTEVNGVVIDGDVETLPGAYERYYASVRDALQQHTPMPVDPADALLTARVIAAAQRSVQTHAAETLI